MNTKLLQSSFMLLVERQPLLVRRFYEILFERYPQAKPLFGRNSSARQEQMLTAALVAVVENVENLSSLAGHLRGLGAKHVAYGVTEEMYGWVGASLLATLAEVAGPDWTPELEATWTEAYGAIAGLMQEGARAATAEAA